MADFASLHESFGRIVQTVCLCALSAALCALGVAWLHEHGIYLFSRFRGTFKSLHGVLAAIAIAAVVAWAGTKPMQSRSSPQNPDPNLRQPQRTGGGDSSAATDYGEGGVAAIDEADVVVGGLVMESAATNAVHDFSMPTNAVVCERWLRRGAARDWFAITNDLAWAFPFGTSAVRRITVSSTGAVLLHAGLKAPANADERALRGAFDPRGGVPADAALLAPLRASLGVVPQLNWNRLDGAESCFWTASTPANTLLLTWRNVLLGRSPGKPVSFQVELTPGGRFRFAYDLSSATAAPCTVPKVAAFFGILRPINVRPVETTTLRRRRWQDVQSLRARLRFVFAWLS